MAGSRTLYEQYLEEQRKKKKTEAQQNKRKNTLDEIEDLKKTQKRLCSDIDSLSASADKLAEKAEATGNLAFIAQSNSHRRTLKDKNEALAKIRKQIDEKVADLKNN